jgi:predicted acylesterase/phospholipase RssA
MTSQAESRVGLSLSGGGFRATLFHLGVVRFLQDAKKLKCVKRIGAVSGGSVFAAHLVLNWERYTDDKTFEDAAREVFDFVRSDVRGRVIRRWIFAWVTGLRPWLLMRPWLPFVPHSWKQSSFWTFTKLLQRSYERLYKKATLSDLRTKGSEPGGSSTSERPQVSFYATSLGTGTVCSFGQSGFAWDENGTERSIRATRTRVALAVAASSAFPPLFPPIAVDSDVLFTSAENFPHPFLLTDGGVYDNLGIDRLVRHQRQEARDLDLFVVSDAGGAFDWQLDRKYTFAVGRNIRASDLLMKRVTTLEYELLGPDENPPFVRVKISRETRHDGGSGLWPEAQHQLQNIRTDLDAFTWTEIAYLVRHGYDVARETFIERGLLAELAPAFSWPLIEKLTNTTDNDADLELLRNGRDRKWRLFSIADIASWATTLWIASLVTVFLIVPIWRARQQLVTARAEVDEAQSKANEAHNKLVAVASGGAVLRTTPTGSADNPVDFGTVPVGQVVERSFVVENIGSGELNADAVIQPVSAEATSSTLSSSGAFSIVAGDRVSVSFGRPQQVAVRYTAQKPGPQRAEIVFRTIDQKFSERAVLAAQTAGQLDFIDRGETQIVVNGHGTHACPDNYAMGGAVFGGNDFECRFVGPIVDVQFRSVDRGGISLACPEGYFMSALNVVNSLIRCSRTSNPISPVTVVSGNQGEMIRCAGASPQEAGVMVGYSHNTASMLCGKTTR